MPVLEDSDHHCGGTVTASSRRGPEPAGRRGEPELRRNRPSHPGPARSWGRKPPSPGAGRLLPFPRRRNKRLSAPRPQKGFRGLTRTEGRARRPSRRGHPPSPGRPSLPRAALDRLEADDSRWHFRRRSLTAREREGAESGAGRGGARAPDEGSESRNFASVAAPCVSPGFPSLRANPTGRFRSQYADHDRDSSGLGKAPPLALP
ncbi:uncharacterized protein [Equus przewalskii]|uniref:Uncharacterized protein n=1 Tax=Equus przewalskii TaxID=9798 RepID=A0ABM2FKW6_EQUPR